MPAMDLLSAYLRGRPLLYDSAKRIKRSFFSKEDAQYRFFDRLSRLHGRKVSFVQIGANDGLRNDPIREFIVRDQWNGILVEPLPTVFETLKANYKHISKNRLVFVNAAISSTVQSEVPFWSFDEDFLDCLSVEERLEFLRKASFDRGHVLRFANSKGQGESILREIQVPCFTFAALLDRYGNEQPTDLLVIDAEGHEATILQGIELDKVRIETIFYESHNLGPHKQGLVDRLHSYGYRVIEMGGDSVAVLTSSELASSD